MTKYFTTRDSMKHKGHNYVYLGTNKDDTQDLFRCYTCKPSFIKSLVRFFLTLKVI